MPKRKQKTSFDGSEGLGGCAAASASGREDGHSEGARAHGLAVERDVHPVRPHLWRCGRITGDEGEGLRNSEFVQKMKFLKNMIENEDSNFDLTT